jgi:hypothetical protein
MRNSKIMMTIAVAAGCATARGNSGVQLPLDQYQAGTETVQNTIVTNGGFEQPGTAGADATGWTAITDGIPPASMSVGAPDPANLPVPASSIGNFSARAGLANVNFNDQYFQSVTVAPDTEYVISSYVWNYGKAGPAPHNDFNAGDLAVVQLRDNTSFFNTAGFILEPVGLNNGPGSRGAFIYKTFNGSQFPAGATLEVLNDPNENLSGSRPSIAAQWDNVAITPLGQFRSQVWTSTAGGTWGDNMKWLNRQANAVGAIATFAPAGVTQVSVTLESDKTAAVVSFEGGSMAIGGTGTLRLQHEENADAVILRASQGSHSISAPISIGETASNAPAAVLNRTLRFDVAPGADIAVSGTITGAGSRQFNVQKIGAGSAGVRALSANIVSISAGKLSLLPSISNDAILRANALTLGPTGELDLARGLGIIDYAVTGPTPLPALLAEVVAGDIFASSLAGNLTVGVAEGSALNTAPLGVTVDATTVLLVSTLKGDSDLDRDVDFNDLLTMAQNYGAPTATFAQGDSDYNGAVDFNDLLSLAQNYQATFVANPAWFVAGPTGDFQSDWQFALSIVPEPSLLSVLLVGGLLGLRPKASASSSARSRR